MAEEDPGVELERKGETEPSADEEVEVSGEIKETDHAIKYIAHFVNAIELYQKKKKQELLWVMKPKPFCTTLPEGC